MQRLWEVEREQGSTCSVLATLAALGGLGGSSRTTSSARSTALTRRSGARRAACSTIS